MSQSEQWMRIAIQEAATAPWPFGAVVVRDGKLLSQAGAGDGEENLVDPTAHAEVNAIRLACKRVGSANLKGATLYASCEPCAQCMGAAWYAGIRSVVYGSPIADEEPLFNWKDLSIPREVLTTITNGEFIVEEGLLREEVLEMYYKHPLYTK